MVEQHYYTRERGGLFTQTDGYDTVAKSSALKLEYIKKNIHPLCSYDLPVALQKSGETDEGKYPESFMIYPAPSGEMIVGQAVYKNKDFTGLRSTFFVHHFILSDKEKRRYVKEPEKLFGITGFATEYSPKQGRELATLAAIPYEGVNPYFTDRSLLFAKLGMDEGIFYKLMYATFVAVQSKKKIFIVLNVPIEALGELSKALLYHLYQELPWGITEKLGVCTYSNKLEAKKSIQITFLDTQSLRYDSKMNKEFIFDFVNDKFLNVEEEMLIEPYMRICSVYSHNKVAWEKFNKWADALSTTLKDQREKNLTYYSQIAILLEMSVHLKAGKGYDMSQHKVRRGLMCRVLKNLQGNINEELRHELTELLEYAIVLLHQNIRSGELWHQDEIKALLQFKLELNEGVLEQEAHCILISLALLEAASEQGQIGYIETLLEAVKRYPATYLHLYQAIYERPALKEKIAYPMIDQALEEVYELSDLISTMQTLALIEGILLGDDYYKQKVYEVFSRCMTSAPDQVACLREVQRWCQKHKQSLYVALQEMGESYFTSYADLSAIHSEQILCSLKFMRQYPGENYEVIEDYQRLRSDLSFMSPQKIRVNTKVQELVKRFYKQVPKADDFYMLVYAFLGIEEETGEPKLNLKEVLKYLHGIQTEMMLDFITWSKGQETYIQQSTFDNQVISAFQLFKQKGEKVPKLLIQSKLIAYPKTKKLGEKILRLQQSPWQRWLHAHRSVVTLGSIVLVGGIGVGVGMYAYGSKSQPSKVEESFKETEIDWIRRYELAPRVLLRSESAELYVEKQIKINK